MFWAKCGASRAHLEPHYVVHTMVLPRGVLSQLLPRCRYAFGGAMHSRLRLRRDQNDVRLLLDINIIGIVKYDWKCAECCSTTIRSYRNSLCALPSQVCTSTNTTTIQSHVPCACLLFVCRIESPSVETRLWRVWVRTET